MKNTVARVTPETSNGQRNKRIIPKEVNQCAGSVDRKKDDNSDAKTTTDTHLVIFSAHARTTFLSDPAAAAIFRQLTD